MTSTQLKTSALALLKKFYGYDSFRPGQFEVIEAVCSGRDAVVIMPTGGGKSICYQMPALLNDGCVVVVSPLIALMQDQVQALMANGIPAVAINSNRSDFDNRSDIDAAHAGRIKIIYLSPERLIADIDQWLTRLNICLFAIDEAHCISQWGHDFRKVYTQLSALKSKFPNIPIMALTATADRLTRDDISRQLGLKDPLRWLGSFNRPNLSLKVITGATSRQKIQTVQGLTRRYPNDSGIVYTLSRKNAESANEQLNRLGIRSTVYHAGLTPSQRQKAQSLFTNGQVQVVCATIAFGMGIDKSNIRWVVHFNLPANIESYYQEIGRAGRDGLPAETVLFYSYQDVVLRRGLIEKSESALQQIFTEKLTQMQRYAEAQVCRRRILMSYFGEEMSEDCHNCDVCLNPPERFDGTILAQKAISAALRTDQHIGIFTMVDILRGSARSEIRRLGYDRLKTYGVGRDLPSADWNFYIQQMVQLGVFEPDMEHNNVLKATPLAMRIVRGQEALQLTQFVARERVVRKAKAPTLPSLGGGTSKELFEYLKGVRMRLASRSGIAPYMVLSDKSLQDMAIRRPRSLDELLDVHGIGEYKAKRFGEIFIAAIEDFLND